MPKETRMSGFLRCCCVLAIAFLLVGCGGFTPDSGVKVTGKITKGGAPLNVPNMEAKVGTIKVDLVPVHAGPQDDRSKSGAFQEPNGTFLILGDGKGVKPGKYKVSIVANPGNGKDDLQGKFDGSASKIEVDIAEKNVGGTQDLGTLELDSYK
jgi:hypothetical protein